MLKKAVFLGFSLLLVLFGFVLGSAAVMSVSASVLLPAQQQADLSQLGLTDAEMRMVRLYEQVSPSVVSISVVARTTGSSSAFPQEEGFSFGSGSGFVIDQQGHIVTNNHVVDGATRIEVNFFDGTLVRGEIVGLDPDADLAVIKVDLPADRLTPVRFGDSLRLVIGQTAVAIGSPFGERWTLTTGVISALDRRITGLNNYAIGSVVQTDAAINPGNSGGPLFNLNGEVIGVNSQIRSQTRSNSGIGYAVPSNLVQRVVNELLAEGRVNYSYLGISGDDVSLNLIENLNLPNNTRGVVVGRVEAGGPAAQAGVRNPGDRQIINGATVPSSADIITAINGQPISDFSGLVAYLASSTRPGETVNLTILREGQIIDLPLVLSARPR